jgi:hypothetical protein
MSSSSSSTTNQKPVSRRYALSLSLLPVLTLALFATGAPLQVKSLTVQRRLHPIERRFMAKSARTPGYNPGAGISSSSSAAPRTAFLLLRAEDEGNEGSDSSENENKKLSTARIGGRNYSKRNNSPPKEVQAPGSSSNNALASILVLLLVVGLVLKGVFGGGGDDYSYYYSYTSSVYETTVVGEDGRVETSRKESGNVRSNVPPPDASAGATVGLDTTKPSRFQRRQDERDIWDSMMTMMMRDQTTAVDQELSRIDELLPPH